MIRQIGHYTVIRQLGEGGMGSVYLAYTDDSDERVAVKIVKRDINTKKSTVERFQREIAICKQFSHPHVVRIIDGGVDSDNNHFLVMEYLKGTSFSKSLKSGTVGYSQIKKIFAQQAEALTHIHSKSIIHRDIKPDNIYIKTDGNSVLIDFGLASAGDMTSISRTSNRAGTLLTMSPEQLKGEVLSESSDIYSLGVTIYFALTGKVPYGMQDIAAITKGKSLRPVKSPRQLKKTVPYILDRVVMKCINLDKDLRYQDGESLRKVLLEEVSDEDFPKEEPLQEDTCNGEGSSQHEEGGRTRSRVREAKVPHKSPDKVIRKKRKSSKKKRSSRNSEKASAGNDHSKLRFITISSVVVILFLLMILCGRFLGGGDEDNKTEQPWMVVNTNSEKVLKLTRQLLSDKGRPELNPDKGKPENNQIVYDAQALSLWMNSVDNLFNSAGEYKAHLHETRFVSVKREIKELAGEDPLLDYVSGTEALYDGNPFQAVNFYRSALVRLAKNLSMNEKPSSIPAPFSKHVVSKISESLANLSRSDVSTFTKEQRTQWFQLFMALPSRQIFGKDALFLRCCNFLSLLKEISDSGSSNDMRRALNVGRGYLLHHNSVMSLPEKHQLYLRELCNLKDGKLPPKVTLGYSSLVALNESSRHSRIPRHRSRMGRPTLLGSLSVGNAKEAEEDLSCYWLMAAHIVVSPESNDESSLSSFGMHLISPHYMKQLSLIRNFNRRIETLRLKYLCLDTVSAGPSSSKDQLMDKYVNLWQQTQSFFYEVNFRGMHRTFNKDALRRHEYSLRQIALIPVDDSIYRNCFRSVLLQANSDYHGAFELASQDFKSHFINNKGKTDSSLVIVDVYRLHHLIVTICNGIFQRWPEKYDLDILDNVSLIISSLSTFIKDLSSKSKGQYSSEERMLTQAKIVWDYVRKLYIEGSVTSKDTEEVVHKFYYSSGIPLMIRKITRENRKSSIH